MADRLLCATSLVKATCAAAGDYGIPSYQTESGSIIPITKFILLSAIYLVRKLWIATGNQLYLPLLERAAVEC